MGTKKYAEDWLFNNENIAEYVSLDETSLSNGELYIVLTNKNVQGKKGSIITIQTKGTKASDLIHILDKIPLEKRNMVAEVSLIWQVVWI